MFIKHGEGKIISIVKPSELTDEQKKNVKKASKKIKEDKTPAPPAQPKEKK